MGSRVKIAIDRRNLIGKRFHRLVVKSVVLRRMKLKYPRYSGVYFANRLYYVCKCDCGNERQICSDKMNRLNSFRIASCGCARKEKGWFRKLGHGEARRNILIGNYISRAKRIGVDFSLSKDEMIRIFQSDCYYCGRKPCGRLKEVHHGSGDYIYNGIDRYDNDVGYIIGNVVPCCKYCNSIKRDVHGDLFIESMIGISKRHKNFAPNPELRLEIVCTSQEEPFTP